MRRSALLGVAATGIGFGYGAYRVLQTARSVSGRHEPAWVPAERGTLAWREHHEALLASVRAAQPRSIFLGDSISERWLNDGLHVWLSDPKLRGAFTLGIGGDTTQNVLWRIAHGTLDGIAPRAVVLLIGTNDIGHDQAHDIERRILTIAREVRVRLPNAQLLLFGILPRGAVASEPVRREIAAINARLAAEPVDSRTLYRDIGAAFCDSEGRQLPDLFHADRVHLTARGYARWARELDPLLRDLGF